MKINNTFIISVICMFLIVGSVNVVSANWLGDSWGKITGWAVKTSYSCVDSDKGIDYATQGKISVTTINAKTNKTTTQTFTDVCRGKRIVREFICNAKTNKKAIKEYKCPVVCVNGACVNKAIDSKGTGNYSTNNSKSSVSNLSISNKTIGSNASIKYTNYSNKSR